MVPLLLKTLLVATNFSILTYLLVLMMNHYNANYDMKSWGFIFHILTFSWLIIRGAFWVATMTSMKWTAISFYLLYWSPTPLEFAAFMILPLYFSQVIYRYEWTRYWSIVRPIYFSAIVGMVVFQAIWSWLAGVPKEIRCASETDDFYRKECFHTEYSSDTFRSITFLCFFLLAVIQGIFGWKLMLLENQHYEQFFSISPRHMALINIVLVVSFASRSIYQLFAICGLFILPDVPIADDGDVSLIIFMCVEFWIYTPIVLIIATITSRSLGRGDSKARDQHRREYIMGYLGSAKIYHTYDDFCEEGEKVSQLNIIEEDEGEYLLQDVPSCHSSYHSPKRFKKHQGVESPSSAVIPIQYQTSSMDPDLRISSLPKSQSWLNESDPQRNWRNTYTPPESANVTLSAYFKHKRIRGGSISSETSSVDGISVSSKKCSFVKPSVSFVRHEVEEPLAEDPQEDTCQDTPRKVEEDSISADENDSNDLADIEQGKEYSSTCLNRGELKRVFSSEYEFQVEPASPNSCLLYQRNDSDFTDHIITNQSYETAGRDHILDIAKTVSDLSSCRDTLSRNVVNEIIDERGNGGDYSDFVVPIAPRPVFGTTRSSLLSPTIEVDFTSNITSSSLSPSLYMFQRSSSGNIPQNFISNRDEAAKEASRARSTLNRSLGNVSSPVQNST